MNDQGTSGSTGETPQTGSGGTTRVSAPPAAGPAGTTRVASVPGPADAGAHGPGGTTRVGAGSPAAGAADLGQFGTTRVGSAASAAGAHAVQAQSSAVHYAAGNTVQLNGIDYQVLGELTSNSSEAITYRVQRGASVFVLKQYHAGIQMPRDVLERVRATPGRNIVRVEDYGAVDGQDVEVLAFIPGGTLDQLLRRAGPIHDLTRLKLLAQGLLDGVHHLHATVRIIYQDLKPENILIADDSLRQVVLADFGISSVLKPGQDEATVVANGTKEYAAPELARFGNQTDVSVNAKVDYFAFGVTLLECWLGKRPFEGVPDAARLRQVRDMNLPLPADMDPQLGKLIAGLLKPLPNDRWGRDEITRWIEGKPLTGSTASQQRQYELLWFNNQESFSTPGELAALLAKYPEKGMDYLYLGKIEEWLNKAGDMDLSTEVLKITRSFDKDPRHRRAGLTRAVYALDPGRPFVTDGERTCLTGEDVGDAFWIEKNHYIRALKDPLDDFHLYLHATGEADNSAQILQHHLVTASETLAFNSTVYTLQGGGRNRIKLGDKFYFTPDEINADPAIHSAMRAELATEHSRGLVWLTKLGFIGGTATLATATAVDAIELLKLFPWLDVQTDAPALVQRQTQIATELVSRNRLDLLDVYRQRGMRFDNPDGGAYPPLAYAASTGNLAAVQFLVEHGAPLDLQDKNGTTPLLAAVTRRIEPVVLFLLEKGADANKTDAKEMTPLGAACASLALTDQSQSFEVSPGLIEPLLRHGAKPDQPLSDGELPLHRALNDSDAPATAMQALEILVKGGASVHQRGKSLVRVGEPDVDALFAALFAYKYAFRQSTAYLPVIQRVIELGADPDSLYDGKRALHFAALWDDEHLARTLIDAGANASRMSTDGMLPAAIAHANGSKAVATALSPGKGYLFRSRLLIAAGALVSALAVLVLLVAAILFTNAFVGSTLQGGRFVATWQDLLTVYLGLVAIVMGIRVTLSPAAAALLPRLRLIFSSVRSAFFTLLLQPAVLLGLSTALVLLMEFAPWTNMFRRSVSVAWSYAIGAVVLAMVATFVALRYSARSAAARTALIGMGAKVASGSQSPGLVRGLRRLVGFVWWWLKAGVVVLTCFIGYKLLTGEMNFRENMFSPAVADSCASFAWPLPRETASTHSARQQECQMQLRVMASADACGVTQFLRTGAGAIRPNGRLQGTAQVRRRTVVGPTTGVERRNLPVTGPVAVCTLRTVENSGTFYIIADRAFNAAMRKAGERDPFVDLAANPAAVEPIGATATSNPPVPESTPAATATSASTPASAASGRIAGAVQGFSPEGWPLIDGRMARLAGIDNLFIDLLPRYQEWIRANGASLECTPSEGSGGYTCVTPDPARVDIGLMAVMNGVATVSSSAPLSYQSAMEDARNAQRGRWKAIAVEGAQ